MSSSIYDKNKNNNIILLPEGDDGRKQMPHYFYLGILSLIYLTMIIIVNPIGDFPLNDDWIYAHHILSLIKNGTYGAEVWSSSPLLIFHVLWGLLFCLFTGFSFTALRFSTLVMGLAGAYVLYSLAFNISQSKRLSFLLALLLIVNPLYFCLSNTFMTDVPFVSMALFSLFFFFKYMDTGKRKFIVLAALFSVAATLIRQFALVIPISYAIASAFRQGQSVKQRLNHFIPLVIALFSYKIAMVWLKNQGAQPNVHFSSPFFTILENPASGMKDIGKRLGNDLFYFGLLFFPSLLFIKINFKSLKSNFILLIFLAGIAVSFILFYREFPFGDYLNSGYIGPMSLSIYWNNHLLNESFPFSKSLLILLYIIGISGTLLLVNTIITLPLKTANPFWENPGIGKKLLVALCILGYAGLLFLRPQIDRYLIPLFPLVGLLVIPQNKDGVIPLSSPLVIFSLIFVIAMALFSAFATHDYLAWQRARWQATDYLTKDRKISLHSIDAGYETNGWLQGYDGRHADMNKPWFGLVDGTSYALSLFEDVDGCQVIRKIPYQCYLPPRDRNMYAVHWYGDFLNTGLILMKENKLDSAAVLFNKVLVESHGKPVPHLHNYIGMLYFIQNKFNEAGQEFRKEISLNLQKEEAYFQLGKMYFISKDTGKAISALDSVISINPSNADGYLNLGACYMLFKHDSRKAQVYFEKAVESNSNLTNAYFNLLIASQKNNDHESFIKYARILLNKGVTIGDLQANGIVISGELMKKIKS